MQLTTKSRFGQILVCLIWLLVLLTTLAGSIGTPVPQTEGALALVPSCPPPSGPLFPWQPRFRWRKWAFQRYQAWQQCLRQARRAYRRAVGIATGARLLLAGMVPLAALVDWLTRAQLRRQLGALPVLYAVLEILQVRAIINRHCPPGAAEIDHGTVALVLILNRLTAPRPLYQVAGWLAKTSLVTVLGVPAAKFNDDRLRRTLEVLAPHLRAIWLDIVHRALVHLEVDLRVLFYDLTAFIVQGAYAHSRLAKFGFAHNTPMNKRKIKEGLVAAADGRVPVDYGPWAGAAHADVATSHFYPDSGPPYGDSYSPAGDAHADVATSHLYPDSGPPYGDSHVSAGNAHADVTASHLYADVIATFAHPELDPDPSQRLCLIRWRGDGHQRRNDPGGGQGGTVYRAEIVSTTVIVGDPVVGDLVYVEAESSPARLVALYIEDLGGDPPPIRPITVTGVVITLTDALIVVQDDAGVVYEVAIVTASPWAAGYLQNPWERRGAEVC